MRKISIPGKLILTLLCGMISVTLLSVQWFPAALLPGLTSPTPQISPTTETTLLPSPVPTATATVVAPFVNLSDLLIIEVEFYPDAQPKVISVKPLEQGRVAPKGVGDTKLQVVDVNGKLVFEISINPIFMYGDPPKKHDSIHMSLIIPNPGQGGKILISSADWTTEYKIDGN